MKCLLTMALTAALFLTGCGRNEPRNTQAASEQRPNNTNQMKAERDNYVNSVEARLAEFDKKIDGLDQRAGVMMGSEKSDFKKTIDQLRDQRKSVGDKLDDLKNVSVDSWTTMKGEVDSALANLDHSYDRVSQMYPNSLGTATPESTTR